MVESQLELRGISSPLVLGAMGRVHREAFVPADLRQDAYADGPLPIDAGQTISQPFIVAFMIQALQLTGGERVLEVGTGSGYAAAVLAEIAATVYSVERLAKLARVAATRLAREGCHNVFVSEGDGTLGLPEEAPFDAIIVSASGPWVPPALCEQLAPSGRLVIPVGEEQGQQELLRVTRTSGGYQEEELVSVRFVPLIGEEGW